MERTVIVDKDLIQNLIGLRERGGVDCLVQFAPKTIPVVNELSHSLAKNPTDTHAAFWLMYLQSYNTLVKSIRDGLKKNGAGVEIHENSVSDWIDIVQESVDLSAQSFVFDDPRSQDLLDTIVSANAAIGTPGFSEFESVLLELPGRVRNLPLQVV